MRSINFGVLESRKSSLTEYSDFIKVTFQESLDEHLIGVEPLGKSTNDLQFASFFTTHKRKEVDIEEFIINQEQLLCKSLNMKGIISQRKYALGKHSNGFEWEFWDKNVYKQKPPAIKPDCFLIDYESKLHILDFKLSMERLLNAGNNRGKEFTSYVNKGISQLFDYYNYFMDTEPGFNADSFVHRNKVSEALGYKIADDPELFIIIGNYETFDIESVNRAKHKRRINILDYDSLILKYCSF